LVGQFERRPLRRRKTVSLVQPTASIAQRDAGASVSVYPTWIRMMSPFRGSAALFDLCRTNFVERRFRSSPKRPGGRTQQIKARLLFVAQRTVEFRERGLHGLHRAKRSFAAKPTRLSECELFCSDSERIKA
jgi:hypothetical protein